MANITEPSPAQLDRATKTLSGAIVLSAIRCTLQYILLPFVLPFLGFTGVVSTIIGFALSLLAVAIILYNMIALWPTSWRWRYMGLGALMLMILGVFLYQDVMQLGLM